MCGTDTVPLNPLKMYIVRQSQEYSNAVLGQQNESRVILLEGPYHGLLYMQFLKLQMTGALPGISPGRDDCQMKRPELEKVRLQGGLQTLPMQAFYSKTPAA